MGKVSQQGTGTSDIHPDCPSHIRTANFHRSPPHRPRWRCIRATICLHISHQNNKPHKWGDDMPFLRRLGCVHSSVSDLCVPEDRRHQPPFPSSYAIGCTRPCRVCSDPDSKSLQSIRTPVGATPAAQRRTRPLDLGVCPARITVHSNVSRSHSAATPSWVCPLCPETYRTNCAGKA